MKHRLKMLRISSNLTQKGLGELLGVAGAAVSKYETYMVPLSENTIIKLCSIFGVSSDYLLGISDTPSNSNAPYEALWETSSYGNTAPYLTSIDKILSNSLQLKSDLDSEFEQLNSTLSGFKTQLESIIAQLYNFGVSESVISQATGVAIEDIRIIINNNKKNPDINS